MASPQNYRMKKLWYLFDLPGQTDLKLTPKRMLVENLTELTAQNLIVQILGHFGMVVARKVTARKCYFVVVQMMR